ncbi:MAG TPA: PIN domain-containing protein [Gaiellaceae bacterium]|nr:PIN domain-containing protein [Gaiellaceae bacterium]
MAVLIDTGLLIEWERTDNGTTLETLIGDEDRAISVITVSELLHGVHRATRSLRVRRSAFVEHLLAGFEPVPITETVARVHAEVWADLSRRGRGIGAHDLWIAATALTHGFGLATRDHADFRRVRGLRVLSPTR